MKRKQPNLTRCKHCGAWINTALGTDPPVKHSETTGTQSDPHAPGDYDDICTPCNYLKGLRGGAA